MSTLADAVASLKGRSGQITQMPRYWDKDQKPTDIDASRPFVFFYIETERARFVSTGGGRGNNIQRTEAELVGLVFVPRDWGLELHAQLGEAVAAPFRSFGDAHVSCGAVTPQPAVDGSSLKPAGLSSEVENFACTVVAVRFKFDGIG